MDDATSTISANAIVGQKDQNVFLLVASLTVSAFQFRSVAFTPQDDLEGRVVFARGTADAGSRILTVSVNVFNGDTTFTVDQNFFATVTSSGAGVFDTRTLSSGDFRSTSGVRVRFLKGVRYLLSMSTSAGTWTNAEACVQMRSVRRAA